jgi:threonine/homoserine/homoserine lactone efflux protein
MKKKKRETSKTVLGSVLIFCGVLMIAVIVGWFMRLENAPEIIATIATVGSAVVAFYLWKAKSENVIKIQRANTLTNEQIAKLLEMADKDTLE